MFTYQLRGICLSGWLELWVLLIIFAGRTVSCCYSINRMTFPKTNYSVSVMSYDTLSVLYWLLTARNMKVFLTSTALIYMVHSTWHTGHSHTCLQLFVCFSWNTHSAPTWTSAIIRTLGRWVITGPRRATCFNTRAGFIGWFTCLQRWRAAACTGRSPAYRQSTVKTLNTWLCRPTTYVQAWCCRTTSNVKGSVSKKASCDLLWWTLRPSKCSKSK